MAWPWAENSWSGSIAGLVSGDVVVIFKKLDNSRRLWVK